MKKMILLSCSVVASGAGLTAPATVSAQDMSEGIVRCGTIAESVERLRCFDSLLPDARKSDAERREVAREKAVADFGLTSAQLNERAEKKQPEKAPDIAQMETEPRIEAKVAGLQIPQYGPVVLTLDNGQVWQTTSFGRLRTVPRVGQQVVVQSGPLGGYRLTLEKQTSEVGVKRIK